MVNQLFFLRFWCVLGCVCMCVCIFWIYFLSWHFSSRIVWNSLIMNNWQGWRRGGAYESWFLFVDWFRDGQVLPRVFAHVLDGAEEWQERGVGRKGGIADREWVICLDFFYCGAIERFQGYCVWQSIADSVGLKLKWVHTPTDSHTHTYTHALQTVRACSWFNYNSIYTARVIITSCSARNHIHIHFHIHFRRAHPHTHTDTPSAALRPLLVRFSNAKIFTPVASSATPDDWHTPRRCQLITLPRPHTPSPLLPAFSLL